MNRYEEIKCAKSSTVKMIPEIGGEGLRAAGGAQQSRWDAGAGAKTERGAKDVGRI